MSVFTKKSVYKYPSLIVILLLSQFLISSCTSVKQGHISNCKHCAEVITNDVTEISVASWNASKYRVTTDRKGYCRTCGDEEVAVVREKKCEHCGKVYFSDRFTSRRSEERRDEVETVGYCNTQCQNLAIAKKAAEETGDAVGEALREGSRVVGRGLQRLGGMLDRN